MIRNAHVLRRFEDDLLVRRPLSHTEALRLLDSLWAEGVSLGVLPSRDPMEGIEADLRVARTLNACSKKSSS
jgi:hypothetical protein